MKYWHERIYNQLEPLHKEAMQKEQEMEFWEAVEMFKQHARECIQIGKEYRNIQ